MSSLAATQADGYYLPPEYYDSGAYKKQSKNDWHEQQQGGGGKGKGQAGGGTSGSVVRFELPYDGFCEGCGHCTTWGTRYNAEKVNDCGRKYFTTPIVEFRMKCRACARQRFVIRTDPAARGFDYASGIVRKNEGESTAAATTADNAAAAVSSSSGAIAEDAPKTALERLETRQAGKRKAMTEVEEIEALQRRSDGAFADDAASNSLLRSGFRVERKRRQKRVRQGEALGWRRGMALHDADRPDDLCEAQQTVFGDSSRSAERKRWSSVRRASIFSGTSGSGEQSSSSKRKRNDSKNNDRETPKPDAVPSSSGSNGKRVSRRANRGAIPTVDLTTAVTTTKKLKKRLALHSSGTLITTTAAATTNDKAPTSSSAASALEALQSYNSSDSDDED